MICKNCGNHIFLTDPDNLPDVWFHDEETNCDDPVPGEYVKTLNEPTIEDRVVALERMVKQQYRILKIFKDGIEGVQASIQLCHTLINKLAEAGESVSTDVINMGELLKIHEKRINAMRNMLEN